MQVQGSGIAQLPNKKKFLIGYAGTNGYPYTSIRKILIQNKELTEQTSSMQDMRAWFARNSEKIEPTLNLNPSYVFFRILENKDPLGTQAIPLTIQRSLAVDKQYIPLGAPIWLDTVVPENDQESSASFQHLLIAQDTGGAIKGIVRGDVYWGGEPKAAFIAGHMKSPGSYWILLPRYK
jgi:membrane-bound lytic murein transglycosylase A